MVTRLAIAVVCCATWIRSAPAAAPAKRLPLDRDVRSGYLMHCTFRAIRPYPWKQEPLLTGWETDSSGGTWQAAPSGFFPNEFAFHTDWFKLHDTSDRHAVTIRHRIARQTEGKVTWEFRFMLPRAMEGATWQLRDLDTVAVGIVCHDGALSYMTPTRPETLAPLEPNHEYGVRVVADLGTKAAEILVDGELKAAAPFVHPVRSIDEVLIKTGDAATGDLFLPLVSVTKGYRVCETFATTGVGRVPADWQVASPVGSARVEPFRASSRPDIFSLKLADGAHACKRFAPCRSKIVCEFRLLFPEKSDGAVAELAGAPHGGGKIVTANGDLCYVNRQGKQVPVIRRFRANLWYAFKVIADPKSSVAEVSVNGKPATQAADFSPPLDTFDAVRFAAAPRGAMWVDDVRVYPWQDYPSDYVPTPQPVAHDGRPLLGVQSCSLWKEGDAYAGWDYVLPFADRRKPYLGWYDDGNPEVADWEIKWQVEHGIDFEQYCWYRPNDAVNQPIKDGVLEQGIRDGLLNARYGHLKKFTIMYTNQGAGDTNFEDWRKHIVPYWIEYFFKDPRYLKIDGKPILSIYYPDNFLRDFGGVEGCRKAIDLLREECLRADLPGIVVLMELRNASGDVMRTMKAMGIDSCYAYTWGTPEPARQRQSNVAQRDAAAAVQFRMIPSISVGWQTAPWDGGRDPGNGWTPVSDYRALARWAKSEFMPTLPQDWLGRRILFLANWNEFGEGHFMMPSRMAGFGYLDALRDTFTRGGPHDDVVPTESQKRRFTVLCPRE